MLRNNGVYLLLVLSAQVIDMVKRQQQPLSNAEVLCGPYSAAKNTIKQQQQQPPPLLLPPLVLPLEPFLAGDI